MAVDPKAKPSKPLKCCIPWTLCDLNVNYVKNKLKNNTCPKFMLNSQYYGQHLQIRVNTTQSICDSTLH